MAGVTLEATCAGGRRAPRRPIISRCRRWCRRCKVDGRRLHELAREGIEVERAPGPVTVHRFDVEPTADPLVLPHRGRRARRAPTSGRWPPTSGASSAAAPTSGTCGAPPSARSPRPRPRPLDAASSCCRRPRRCGTADRSTVDEAPVADRHGRCSGPAGLGRGRARTGGCAGRTVDEPLWPHTGAAQAGRRPSARRSLRRAPILARAGACHDGVASAAVQVITDLGLAWPGERHRGHHRRLRRRAPRPPGRHRQVRHLAADAGRPLRGGDLRPPPRHGRAAGVGAPAAHRLDQRLELLPSTGVDATVVVPLRRGQRHEEPPRTSSSEVLVDCARRTQAVVVGEDFHFGHHRAGQRRAAATSSGAITASRSSRSSCCRRVPTASTSRSARPRSAGPWPAARSSWRPACSGAPTRCAARSCGRPAGPAARLPHGQRRGAQQICLPADGVYAGWYERPDGSVHPCAINLGRRPTFYEHADHSLLEAHLLDFAMTCTASTARVRFSHFLRSERKFDGIDALVASSSTTSNRRVV